MIREGEAMKQGTVTPAFPSDTLGRTASIALALLAAQAVALHLLGMPTICRCGTVAVWYGNPSGPETSQQLTDWYTYTHVLHGFAFYALLHLAAPRLPVMQRLLLAIGIEVAWEIFENSPWVIERYRRGGLAQGYTGDSIVNSLSDTIAATVGFVLEWRLPVAAVIGLAIGAELLAIALIRDGLLLNVVQLLFPSEALSAWQARR